MEINPQQKAIELARSVRIRQVDMLGEPGSVSELGRELGAPVRSGNAPQPDGQHASDLSMLGH